MVKSCKNKVIDMGSCLLVWDLTPTRHAIHSFVSKSSAATLKEQLPVSLLQGEQSPQNEVTVIGLVLLDA